VAIAYVSTGSSSRTTAGNTSPGIPSGLAGGELMILFDGAVSYSGSGGPATPGTPSGWTQVVTYVDTGGSGLARVTLMWRLYVSGDSAPTVTYTPNSGGGSDNHYSQIYAFSGASGQTDVLGSGSSCSASGSSCGPISGITTTVPGSLVFLAAVRDDTMTSSTVASGDGLTWTKGSDFSDGGLENGLSAFCDWAITSSPQAISSKTITVNATSAEAAGIIWSMQAQNPPVPPAVVPSSSVHRAAIF
jgi:hypothetical protein